MKNTFLMIFIFVLVIAGLFAIRFYLGGAEDTWICRGGQWIAHGKPKEAKPTKPCEETTSKIKNNTFKPAPAVASLVKDYLNQNISKLSPEKEVLGGKFYITNLTFRDNETAIVSYEDGHNAFMALFKFTIGETEDVQALDFQILNKN